MAVDPFEAAMAQLQQDPGDRPSDAPRTTNDDPAPTAAEPAAAAPIDPFEAALQTMDQVDTGANAEDPIAGALAVADSTSAAEYNEKDEDDEEFHVDINFLMDINVTMTFEVGRAKMYISDLLSLGQGSVIELHRLVGEDLEILVNGNLLATGEVVVVNEKFGAKVTKILSPEERVTRLGPTPM